MTLGSRTKRTNSPNCASVIDGGGIKGVFEAAFLAEVESAVKPPQASCFDLIAWTSTGGVIALGLGLGISSAGLLDFYKSYGPARSPRPQDRMARLHYGLKDKVTCKCPEGRLRYALERTLGNMKLGDSRSRLVIPAFNLSAGGIHVYKTCHHPRFQTDYKVRAVDVALATTAAPTYFPVHTSEHGILMIDGGIWANNPTGVAVIEAIRLRTFYETACSFLDHLYALDPQ